MSTVKFKDRFGKEVEFVRKAKRFYRLPGESFMRALYRTYYYSDYKKTMEAAGLPVAPCQEGAL